MDGEAAAGTFAQALATLKRRGCGLLVVGAACDETHLDISRRLLGATESTRRRIVVLTDAIGDAEDRLPDDASPETARVIERRPMTRGAAASATTTTEFDTTALAAEIEAAVSELGAKGLGPSELRLCLDSIRPILDEHGVVGTERFLADVLGTVRKHHGMAHVHLPVASDTPVISSLEGSFDAVIELRDGEQRWRVVDDDVQTEWLPVSM